MITIRSSEYPRWVSYFEWLGRAPAAFQRLAEDPEREVFFTVPELEPEWFDENYMPRDAKP